MNCDICGKEISNQAFRVVVEGAKMMVCGRCQRLGKPYEEEKTFKQPLPQNFKQPLPPGIVAPRVIQKRAPDLPRGMSETDIIEDYAEQIKKHRMKLGLIQDQLAKLVKERLSILQKIETGKMMPDTRLCRQLEHVLKMKLLVPHKELSDVPNQAVPVGVMVGDIIRVKGKTNLKIES